MNKEQLDAIKERVASMKQQARTDVTADISAIEIAFQDVPALIAEVERLQKQVATDFFKYGELTTAYEEVAEENARLREALRFYADAENWERTYQDSDVVAQGQLVEYWEPSLIEFDKGKKALQALGDDDE